jgi:hypothetical protein
MNYKGIEYSVVQTACPTGWKWTVYLDADTIRTGSTYSKEEAVRRAQLAVDKAIAAPRPKNTPAPKDLIEFSELRQRYTELQRLRELVRQLEETTTRGNTFASPRQCSQE